MRFAHAPAFEMVCERPLARFARVSPSRGGDYRLQRESFILPLRGACPNNPEQVRR
jgi:hypothetical protein